MVRWVKLGEVCTFKRGQTITAKQAVKGNVPVVAGGQKPSYFHNQSNRKAECITVAGSGAYAGFVSYWTIPIWVSDAFTIETDESLNTKYLFYFLKLNQQRIFDTQKGAGVPHVHGKDIDNFEIPLPSLSEQQRIVDILDKFEGMVENVEKELLLRQKQYEFYREKMIAEVSSIGIVKTLGEIGTFIRGNGLQKSDFVDKGRPCIHYGQIHTYYGLYTNETISYCKNELWKKLKHARKGDLLIATTSEDVEACCKATAWMGEEEVAYSGDSICFSHNQNPIYVAHLFKTESFAEQKKPAATGAKVVRVSGDAMSKFKFPFPSPDKQQEIVAKLDKFEEMISTLKRELELRKKQYEYYREKLLTFE